MVAEHFEKALNSIYFSVDYPIISDDYSLFIINPPFIIEYAFKMLNSANVALFVILNL